MASAPDTGSAGKGLARPLTRAIIGGCGYTLLLTAIAYFFELRPWMSVAAAIPVAAFVIGDIHAFRRMNLPRCVTHDLLVLPAVLIDTLLIILYVLARTDDAIVSPWDVLPIGVFLLYACSTALLFLTFRSLSAMVRYAAFMLHAVTTYGVSLIIYALGFGYDPFIHQAAERHLASVGHIEPRQILYLGQYALVTGLSHLTGIATRVIDVALVPLLAITVIPFAILKRFPDETGLLLFLVASPFLAFTIPYHLAVICLLLILWLGPGFAERKEWLPPVLLAAAALAAHPLAGIPAVLLAAAWSLPILQTHTGWRALILAAGSSVAMIGAFVFQAISHGGTVLIPTMETLVSSLKILFGDPYASSPSSWFKLFYDGARLFQVVWIFVGIIGMGLLGWKKILTRVPIALAISFFVTAIFLARHIQLEDILPYEQYEFALRLVALLPLIFLEGVAEVYRRFRSHLTAWSGRLILVILLGMFAASQWLFTYPQPNLIVPISARGMGREEQQAVRLIDASAASSTYAVLAYPLLSIAALEAFGFERTVRTTWGETYFYPIPTGNELYALYLMILETDDPEIAIKQVFGDLNVERLYIAVLDEWDPDGVIRARLAPLADETMTVPRITIYLIQSKTPR